MLRGLFAGLAILVVAAMAGLIMLALRCPP